MPDTFYDAVCEIQISLLQKSDHLNLDFGSLLDDIFAITYKKTKQKTWENIHRKCTHTNHSSGWSTRALSSRSTHLTVNSCLEKVKLEKEVKTHKKIR